MNATTLPAFYEGKYLEIRSRYEDHEALLTDESKDEEGAGAAGYTNVETLADLRMVPLYSLLN